MADLDSLGALPELETLDLGYCTRVKDLAPLRDLPKLRALDTQGLSGVINAPDRSDPSDRTGRTAPGRDYVASVKGVPIRMVWVPGDTFDMGSSDSEESGQKVTLDGFWLSATLVTQAQYDAVTGEKPSRFEGRADNPVEKVSWDDAVKFCEALGAGYGLPTEAQWEYACRAGSTDAYCFGDSEKRLAVYGWYDENAGGKTHAVGEKRANVWSLYDMHGNLWEWCHDWYGEYSEQEVQNPRGPEKGDYRVLRGGSWNYYSGYCRCADRDFSTPDLRFNCVGFRVARTP